MTHGKCLASIALVLVLASCVLAVGDGIDKTQPRLPCERGRRLLRDDDKKVVVLDSEAMKERAVRRVAPKYPRTCRCEGAITVDVVVNEKGRVACVDVRAGNPLLRGLSIVAAKEWQFEPMLSEGKPVSFKGRLTFNFSLGGEVTF